MPEARASSGASGGSPLPGAMGFLVALVPACLVAAHVGNVADAAHDAGVARAMGLEAQPWRALDAVVASVFAALPLGTRAARAGLAFSATATITPRT